MSSPLALGDMKGGMDLRIMEIPTPFGCPLSVAAVAGESGSIVLASGFEPVSRLRVEDLATQARVTRAEPADLAETLRAWLDGDVLALDRVSVRQVGTPFRERVWDRMRAVPAGSTVTYAELARLAGHPRAARAVGGACAANRVAPFVPCHRVVPTGGGIGKYGYGASVKSALLEFEARHRDTRTSPRRPRRPSPTPTGT